MGVLDKEDKEDRGQMYTYTNGIGSSLSKQVKVVQVVQQ